MKTAVVNETATGFELVVTDVQEDGEPWHNTVRFDTREEAELARHHFLTDYSGFNPLEAYREPLVVDK